MHPHGTYTANAINCITLKSRAFSPDNYRVVVDQVMNQSANQLKNYRSQIYLKKINEKVV